MLAPKRSIEDEDEKFDDNDDEEEDFEPDFAIDQYSDVDDAFFG